MARDVIRPHARSAFRRVLSLHKIMYDLSVRIEGFQQEGHDPRLDVIRAVVDGQIVTGKTHWKTGETSFRMMWTRC